MAVNRYTCEKYASLEINTSAFEKTGLVVSQTPLHSAFTAAAPCENGMWVDADKGNGAIKQLASTTKTYGIVFTAEREYEPNAVGLKNFCQIAGDYPRVGILSEGETFTSNCFCYDTVEFANVAAVDTALAALDTTPLYLVPVNSSAVPKITASAPGSGMYARVIKPTTVPNGEKAIKYSIMNV